MNLFRQFHGGFKGSSLFHTSSNLVDHSSQVCDHGGRRRSKTSVVPILENWVQQDRESKYSQLQEIIRDLHSTRRFNDALQMLQWMGDKGGYGKSAEDFAVQLELISRVHGIEQAETYFDTIPNNLRGYGVYFSLLSSYAHHRCLEKAEATMEKLRELGFLRDALPYNVMLSLYFEMREVGYADDMDLLAEEMREKGINKDNITYNILLKVYGENLLIEKMEKLFREVDADPFANIVWEDDFDFEHILTMLKKKSEESREVSLNEVYLSTIWYLSKNGDMDGAERFWEEWFSKRKEMDFRIPRAMIWGYGKNGQWEKAEAIVFRMRESGIDADTLHMLAGTYERCKQMDKAEWSLEHLITIAVCLERPGDDAVKEDLYKMLNERPGVMN